MKKYLDIAVWALLLFLITPSGMALASWNAVPGDATYSWKLSLEKVALALLSPSDALQSATQVKIAERRFNEFQKVATSEYAATGIVQLNQQLSATTTDIKQIKSATVKTEARNTYVATLKKMNADLEEQKRVVVQETSQTTTHQAAAPQGKMGQSGVVGTTQPTTTQQDAQLPPTNATGNNMPSANTTTAPAVPLVPTTSEQVAQQIEQTQSNIEQIIQELEDMEFEGEEEDESENKGGNGKNGNGEDNQGKDKGKGDDLKGLTPDEKKGMLEEIK